MRRGWHSQVYVPEKVLLKLVAPLSASPQAGTSSKSLGTPCSNSFRNWSVSPSVRKLSFSRPPREIVDPNIPLSIDETKRRPGVPELFILFGELCVNNFTEAAKHTLPLQNERQESSLAKSVLVSIFCLADNLALSTPTLAWSFHKAHGPG